MNGCDRDHMFPKSKLFIMVLFKKNKQTLSTTEEKTQYLVHPSGFSSTVQIFGRSSIADSLNSLLSLGVGIFQVID